MNPEYEKALAAIRAALDDAPPRRCGNQTYLRQSAQRVPFSCGLFYRRYTKSDSLTFGPPSI